MALGRGVRSVLAAVIEERRTGVSDTAAGVTLLARIATAHPHITTAWVDAGYRTTAIDPGPASAVVVFVSGHVRRRRLVRRRRQPPIVV